MKVALDLCCGRGGWAHGLISCGWSVVGVDVEEKFRKKYPGVFVCADLLEWDGYKIIEGIGLVVASPPCEQFSRHSMPWTRAANPPAPDVSLWRRCEAIAKELGVPLVLENVRGAEQFMGRSRNNCGPFYLWGDVPAIVPAYAGRSKSRSLGGRDRAARAVVPVELSVHVGRVFA